jgi:hypothetical protein
VVFSFKSEEKMEEFRRTRNMDCVLERKLAAMLYQDYYTVKDVVELFENPHSYYLLYEVSEPLAGIKMGIIRHREDAS